MDFSTLLLIAIVFALFGVMMFFVADYYAVEAAEFVAVLALIIAACIGGVLLITIPFAVIGWGTASIVMMFGVEADPSYWQYASGGFGIAMIVSLIVYIIHGRSVE